MHVLASFEGHVSHEEFCPNRARDAELRLHRLTDAQVELLDVCQAMARAFDLWVPTDTDREHEGEYLALNDLRSRIIAVIKRATGESP